MSEINKVLFGLSNVYFSLVTFDSNGTPTFGTPHKHPGAVNLTLEQSGSVTPFYADNIVYYQASSNQGYTGTIELAMLDEWFRMNVLRETKDADGVLVENAAATPAPVAVLYQVEGDQNPVRRVLYYVQPERAGETNATKADTVEPQTATLNITVTPLPNTQDIKASTTPDTDSEVYEGWFSEVHIRNGVYTPSADLESLTLGTLTLSPEFAPETTSYTATTTNATNIVSAVAKDAAAEVTITNNENPVANGLPVTWDAGSNELAVTVTNGTASKEYTVTVTKS